jgi:hypothetical protein
VQASRSARDLIPAAYPGLRIGTGTSSGVGGSSSSASSSRKQLLPQRASGDGANNWLEQLPSKKADTPRAIYAELQSLQVSVAGGGLRTPAAKLQSVWCAPSAVALLLMQMTCCVAASLADKRMRQRLCQLQFCSVAPSWLPTAIFCMSPHHI